MDDKALFVNTNSESENNRVPNGSILEMLANHSHLLPDWLLLIVTCRRKYRSIIKHMFPGIKTIAIDDLRKPMIAQDIQEYMTCRFNEESIQCSNEVRLEMMHLLRIKSSACMLYLETVLDLIRDGRINLQDVAFIPGTLNGLFLWLCQHLFPLTSEFDSESTFVSVKPLLNIMLASCEPLSVQSLYSVLLVSKPDLAKSTFYQQLHQLKPIISLNYESSDYIINKTNTSGFMDSLIVHFLHEVFAEWLIDVKHCTSTYLCNITDGQFLIEKALVNNTKYDSSYISRNKDNDSYDRNLLLLSSEEYPGLIVRKSNDNDVTLDLCKASMLIKKSKSADQTDSRYMANTLDCTTLSSDPNVVPDSNHVIYPQTNQLSDVDHNRIGYDYSTYSMKERDEEYGTAEQLRQKTSICHELISAIRLGQYENIKLLLESDADPNTIDQDGWSALRTAAWGGYSDIVQLLIYYGADVNLSGPDGRTALRAAAWAGNVGTVKCLLNAGADVNKSDSEKRTALIAAAYMGHKDVLEVLLEAGADVNHSDSDGRTALHVAAFCVQKSDAHADIVASLLNHGANPNLSDSEGITPLLGASNTGNCVVCELCLEADADVNITDKSGRTPVMLAVLGGYTHIVRLLLFWGATVDIMDYAGRSLLSIAAQIKNAQIVQELLARGLDEAHKDHSGCTPLHLTLENSCDSELSLEHENNQDECCEEVIRLLLDAGASLEETDNAGRTSLLVACQANNINAVHILLNYSTNDPLSCRSPTHSGSSESRQQLNPNSSHGHLPHYVHPCINIASYDGQTPLRAAAFNGNQDMVKLLLSYGADPDHQDAYGRTTLYMLALEGQLDMADLLLHCPAPGVLPRPGSSRLIGANPVLSDDEGRFPLHVVTWLGHVDFVRLLLQAGTPVDIRDREGRTPLQLAAWQGHAEICHILLNEGNARVDAVCSQGATALCIAAQEGHLDVCKVLLQANANPLQTDSHGRTPYRVALKAGHLEICKLLELSQPDFTMINGQWQSINNDPFQNKHVKDMKTRRDSDKVPQFPVSSQQKYAVNNTPIVSDSPAKINSKEFQVVRTENLNQNISPRQHNQPSKVYYDDDNPYARPPELFTTRFVPTKKSVTHCGQPSQTSISHGSHHIVEDMKTVHNQNCIPKSGYYIPLEQKNHTHENWWNTPVCYQSQPTSTETNHTPVSCNLNSGYPLHMIIPSEGVHIHGKFDQNHLPVSKMIHLD
uniref:ANK_REP_REGION domain-containing protein n=1 Tax=Trichobilharzia regenti TaxID=157069 RepID=A0AA85K2G5_TRIRE|nr:unnamed protein product [Trichobilharzia regenti]